MESEKTWLAIFDQLIEHQHAEVVVGRQRLTIRAGEHVNKYQIVTPVYQGVNFIPPSVRKSVSMEAPFSGHTSLHTYLRIDEKAYQVNLYHLGPLDELYHTRKILEEFSWIAEEWRTFLEEQGHRDLVHVPV